VVVVSSSPAQSLCTGVRGRGILRSSTLLAAFATMGDTAPVGQRGERRFIHGS
jgi:hypothetical protein